MPIYEYTCSKCNSDFELLVRGDMSIECPECHSTKLEKQWSVPAAPVASSGQLPICDMPRRAPTAGGCGLPQCGTGCQFD